MKQYYTYFIYVLGLHLAFVGVSNAQNNTLMLKSPSGSVTIDGDRKEWGDSLNYYNPENKLNYTIANDKQNIYLVIKTKDIEQQANILNSGVTFGIDTKGRKRSSFTLTFPVAGQSMRRPGKPTLEENILKAKYLALRKIKVDGFKDIDEEELAVNNSYGIKAAINIDNEGTLVYEQAIPLELFRAGDLLKSEWTFNIKIQPITEGTPNGFTGITSENVTVPAGSRGGSSGGRSSAGGVKPHIQAATIDKVSPSAQATKAIDFWGKFNLAQ